MTALRCSSSTSLDRADEEFEGFLLELLADYQITIPELGTFHAAFPPVVVITSNRTREVHDALKRRCLYYWVDYPDYQKELQIVTARLPDAPRQLAQQVTGFIQELRETELYKIPGVSETLDWTSALMALNMRELGTRGHRRHPRHHAQVSGRHRSRARASRARAPPGTLSQPRPPPRRPAGVASTALEMNCALPGAT